MLMRQTLFRLASDVANAFPSEEAVNEALRFVLKVINDVKHLVVCHI